MFYKKKIEGIEELQKDQFDYICGELRKLENQLRVVREDQQILEGFSFGRSPKKILISRVVFIFSSI